MPGTAASRARGEPGQADQSGGRHGGRCSRAAGSRPWTPTTPMRRSPGQFGRGAVGSCAARRRSWGAGPVPGSCRTCRGAPPAARRRVDVVAVEGDRLAHPDPGHRQQPNQRGERRPPQRAAQRAGGRDQRGDVGVGIQVGLGPVRALRQQIRGRHLVHGVQGVQVGGEPAHRREPVGPPARAAAGGQPRPVQRRRDGDRRGVGLLEVVEELPQQLLRAGQPVAQRAP